MNKKDNKHCFKKIKKLGLSKKEKARMTRLIQVRGKNHVNKVMNYESLKKTIKENDCKITSLVLGPAWSRLVFMDISIDL